MATASIRPNDETQIRGLIEDWAQAVRASDLDGIMSHYAPDIVAFDAAARLQFKGRDAYREHWQACLAMCPGQIFEVHDLQLTARDDVAFGHYLSRCGGTGADGVAKVAWMRGTVCCRKVGGRWLVAHEHFSAPFNLESGKALFELEP